MGGIGVEISGDKEVIAWGLGLIFTAALGALGVRKKYWRDNAQQTESTAGHNAVMWWKDEAQLQRVRADKAIDDRNSAMMELGGLRAETSSLRIEVDRLRAAVGSLEVELRKYRNGNGYGYGGDGEGNR